MHVCALCIMHALLWVYVSVFVELEIVDCGNDIIKTLARVVDVQNGHLLGGDPDAFPHRTDVDRVKRGVGKILLAACGLRNQVTKARS